MQSTRPSDARPPSYFSALARWAIEIKRALAIALSRGFHAARADLEPDRCFVVHPGRDRYPLAAGIEAIGLRELADQLDSH